MEDRRCMQPLLEANKQPKGKQKQRMSWNSKTDHSDTVIEQESIQLT